MKKNKKLLILSSSSFNRSRIISNLKINYKVFIPNINEKPFKNEKPEQLVKRLSILKAQKAQVKNKNNFILAADTVVYVRKKFLDKTDDEQKAILNLKMLSGRRHRVYTGITFISDKKKIYTFFCKTIVKFRLLDERDIEIYIKQKEWKNCAGSYSIQGLADAFILNISGSYSNVVGLPLEKVFKLLKKYNFFSS